MLKLDAIYRRVAGETLQWAGGCWTARWRDGPGRDVLRGEGL